MTATNAKFAITTKGGRSVVMEFVNYQQAQKYADKHFGRGCIVQLVGFNFSRNPVVNNAVATVAASGE